MAQVSTVRLPSTCDYCGEIEGAKTGCGFPGVEDS
jgi:hypothetical protein